MNQHVVAALIITPFVLGIVWIGLEASYFPLRKLRVLRALKPDEWLTGETVRQLSGVSRGFVYVILDRLELSDDCKSRLRDNGQREYMRI